MGISEKAQSDRLFQLLCFPIPGMVRSPSKGAKDEREPLRNQNQPPALQGVYSSRFWLSPRKGLPVDRTLSKCKSNQQTARGLANRRGRATFTLVLTKAAAQLKEAWLGSFLSTAQRKQTAVGMQRRRGNSARGGVRSPSSHPTLRHWVTLVTPFATGRIFLH